MPPKASETGAKMVPADCVSVLLMAIGSTSISKAQYDMMSALDGTRTASSFEHQFRSIIQKAKELKQRADNGETFAAVAPSKKRGAGSVDGMTTPPVTPKKPKATPKPRTKKAKAKAVEDDNSPTNELGNSSSDGDSKIMLEPEFTFDTFDQEI